MTYTVPTKEPTQLTAGDSWQWDRCLADFPASDGWELSYFFYGLQSEVAISAAWGDEVTANGDTFEVRIPAEDTDTEVSAGPYQLVGRVTKAGVGTFTAFLGHVDVLANPAEATGTESEHKKHLDRLYAARATLSTNGYAEVSEHGHTVVYRRQEELDKEIARYEYLVALERNPDAKIQHVGRFVNA